MESVYSHPAYGLRGDALVYAAVTSEVNRETLFPGWYQHEANIHVMTPDGADSRPVTNPGSRDLRPCLSPDGDSVAFLS